MSWASNCVPSPLFTIRHLLRGLQLLPFVVVCWLADPQLARAESEDDDPGRERARALATEGIELLERERWADAHTRLSEAYALFQAPTVAVLDAGALEKLGRLVEAYERYGDAANASVAPDAPKPFRRAVREAKRARERLTAIIPSMSIDPRYATADDTIEVNDVVLPREQWGRMRMLDPGQYTVVAKRRGTPISKESLRVDRGTTMTLVLALPQPSKAVFVPPAPAPESSRSMLLPYSALSLGVAGIATGVIAGSIMLSARSDLDRQCSSTCPREARDSLNRFRTARVVSAAGYSAGAVGLGLGLWLLLDEDESEPPVTGNLLVNSEGGQLTVQGKF